MSPYYEDGQVALHLGDALDVASTLPDGAVDCIVTSPPYYGLRDYGVPGQYGTEDSPGEYVENMVALLAECRRTLTNDGTLWLNIGDRYTGSGGNGNTNKRLKGRAQSNVFNRNGATHNGGLPARNLMGTPWKLADALQRDGWYLRQDIIWKKPNGLPTNAPDRFESRHEHVFLLSKSSHYKFNPEARKRCGHSDVWEIPTQSVKGAHVAVMPLELAERAVFCGTEPGDTVLDPFSGTATTGRAALNLGRKYIGVDINPEYHDLALNTRLAGRGAA